jgi:hypothetical protein
MLSQTVMLVLKTLAMLAREMMVEMMVEMTATTLGRMEPAVHFRATAR